MHVYNCEEVIMLEQEIEWQKDNESDQVNFSDDIDSSLGACPLSYCILYSFDSKPFHDLSYETSVIGL